MESIIGGVPSFYDYINCYNAAQNPSTMHASDTGLSRFFQRYLLQRAISQFKWTAPKEWHMNYALYCLYCWGYFAVVNTNRFGVIPQGCGLKGYGVMYQPTQVVISNPLIRNTLELTIDKNCTLIRLQPDYGGVLDLVNVYADAMAMTMQTAGVNIVNSKLSYLFFTENKAGAESMKVMADKVLSGEPAVISDKNLLTEDGQPTWIPFANSLKNNYIAPELLQNLQEWEERFDTEIGIPHTNTDKKERLVKGEVNANAAQSYTRVEMWLDNLKESCEKTRKMFGIDLDVDWRIDPKDIMNDGGDTDVQTDTSKRADTV